MKFLTLALSGDKGNYRVIGYDMSTMLAYSLIVSEEEMPNLRIGTIAEVSTCISEVSSEMQIKKVIKITEVESDKITSFLDYLSQLFRSHLILR